MVLWQSDWWPCILLRIYRIFFFKSADLLGDELHLLQRLVWFGLMDLAEYSFCTFYFQFHS